MDSKNKKWVAIVDANGNPLPNKALLFGNNAAWHCVLCDELNGDTTMNDGIAECQCGKRYRVLPEDENTAGCKSRRVCALPMTAEQLAAQLVKMRNEGEKEAALHLFGIRYGAEMTAITPGKVALAAGLEKHMGVEINKGKKLATLGVKITRPL